jgi:SAM-dependent methyltransferase
MDPATVALYERHAPEWSRRRGSATDGLGRRFRDQVGTGLIVDLGCGSGRYLPEIGPPMVGADVTAAMLCLARTQGFPLVRCDIEALPFADGVLAGAFARHSYLHLVKDRVALALADLRRALRPGGLLLITLIEGDYQGHDLPGDDFPGRLFTCWTEAELTGVLVDAGFVDIHVEHVERRYGGPDLHATAHSRRALRE